MKLFGKKNSMRKRVCKTCGKIEYVSPTYASRPYCSRKCMAEYFSKNYIGENSPKYVKDENLIKECEYCGKTFRVPPRLSNRKTCSSKCGNKNKNFTGENNPNWKGGNIIVECVVCKKKYEVRPGAAKTTKCCSYKCLGIYSKSKMPNKDTKIELIVENWLIENKIKYNKQMPIEGICIPDFIVGNKLIFCDGDYWHNLPKTLKKDKKVNIELKKNGYEIIRLWEHEIYAGKRPNI